MENALSRSFDYLLQKQLDAEWHRIGAQTKGLMQDMRTLRRLLEHLVRMDCATFYLLLLQLKSAASAQAVKPAWLMSSPADTLFRTAKERVYKITSGAGAAAKRGGKNSAAGAGATSSTSSSSSSLYSSSSQDSALDGVTLEPASMSNSTTLALPSLMALSRGLPIPSASYLKSTIISSHKRLQSTSRLPSHILAPRSMFNGDGAE